jgi:putative membrane protein
VKFHCARATVVAGLIGALVAGCEDRGVDRSRRDGSSNNVESRYDGPAGDAARGTGERPGRLSDAEILGIARTLNLGEVQHSTAVRDRLVASNVRAFADRMIEEHGAAVRKVDEVAGAAGLTPVEGERSNDLAQEVSDKFDGLRDEDGEDLDEAYLDDQKGMHEKALDTIDELRTATSNAQVGNLLDELRGHVVHHLDLLKGIEDTR